jgi:hypothetical protein
LAFADKNVGETAHRNVCATMFGAKVSPGFVLAKSDHAFRLGLMLIGVLLSGSVLAWVLYTFLAGRLKQQGIAGSAKAVLSRQPLSCF